jgi:hypothetical protein
VSAGYGTEVWCTDSIVPGRYATGWRVVAQALYRRVITPRGMLRGGEEEAAYGFDLAGYVGAVGYPTAVNAIPGIVRGEWLKDDRVADVDIRAFIVMGADGAISITLDATVLLSDEGDSFDLTLSISTGGVQQLFSEAS